VRYDLVYDVATEPVRGWPLGIVAVVAGIVGVAALVLRRRIPEIDTNAGRVPGGAFVALLAGAVAFITGSMLASSLGDQRDMREALRDGRATPVEGPVFGLKEDGYQNHRSVSFEVDGTRLEYSESSIDQNGYRTLPSKGSPLRDGLAVRIVHLGPRILRLEIRRPE